MRQLQRVLKVLRLLQGQQHLSAGQLACECQVSRRTFYRDLRAIEEAGFTVWYDQKVGGYLIHERDFLPPLNLTVAEASELFMAASLLDENGGIPLLCAGRDILSKLEVVLPLDVRLKVLHRVRTTAIRLGPAVRWGLHRTRYALVQEAIEHCRTVSCRYSSPGDNVPLALSLEPYWLLFHGQAWYVIGHSDYHDRVNTFRLSRLMDVTLTEHTFARPPRCKLADYLGNAWGVIRGDKTYAVRLRFSSVVAADVAEVQWHKTQQTIPQRDGGLLFSVTVDGLDEVAWWVHSFGAHVRVLEPEALRVRVGEIASPKENGIATQLFGTED